MVQRLNPLKLVILASLLFLCSCGQQAENSSLSSGASAGDVTRWSANKLPLDLRVSDGFVASEATGFSDMTDEWHTAVENKVDFFQGITSTANLEYTNLDDYNDGVMGVYRLNTWPSGLPSSALAVTQLYGIRSGSSISLTHADILLNEENYDFSTDPNDFASYDFHTVMLHELGHFLGLGHQSFSVESVMQPSVSKLDANRETSNVDRANIATNYSVVTSYNAFSTHDVSNVSISAGLSSSGNESGKIRIVVQLMANGECQHTADGKVYHVHKVPGIEK